MPDEETKGKAEEPLADNVIVLFGKKKRLDRPKGRWARLMMPRLLNFLAKAFGGLSITTVGASLLSGRDWGSAPPNVTEIVELIVKLTAYLGEEWEAFERDILPFLLQCTKEEEGRLENEGDIFEVYTALYRAMRYYLLFGFTDAQREAFRKLFSESERRNEEEEAKNAQEEPLPA